MTDLEAAHDARLATVDSGSYRSNTRLAVSTFIDYCHDRGVRSLDGVDTDICRGYALHLRERTNGGEISASSARHYFSVVRAWLGWCVRDGRLSTNPADRQRADEPLPEDTADTETQFWTERERDAILATVDRRVDLALDGDDDAPDVQQAYRDRALVYALAWSGCRGAELLRDPRDEKREGLYWRDVRLDSGTLTVLGKSKRGGSRERQTVALLSPGRDALRKWANKTSTEPETPVWPRMDNAAGENPPSITVRSLRTVLTDLCEWSAYEFEETLRPHGARRRLGDDLYQEQAELAQEQLRHQSIETTNRSYAESRTERHREKAEEALFSDDEGASSDS